MEAGLERTLAPLKVFRLPRLVYELGPDFSFVLPLPRLVRDDLGYAEGTPVSDFLGYVIFEVGIGFMPVLGLAGTTGLFYNLLFIAFILAVLLSVICSSLLGAAFLTVAGCGLISDIVRLVFMASVFRFTPKVLFFVSDLSEISDVLGFYDGGTTPGLLWSPPRLFLP